MEKDQWYLNGINVRATDYTFTKVKWTQAIEFVAQIIFLPEINLYSYELDNSSFGLNGQGSMSLAIFPTYWTLATIFFGKHSLI